MEKPRDDICGCCGRSLPKGPLFLLLKEAEERGKRERKEASDGRAKPE